VKRGFTFVEAVVAAGLAALLIGAAWTVLSSSTRQGRATDVRLQGVNAALTFVQRFEHDMGRLCLDEQHDVGVDPDGKPGVTFHVFDDEASTLPTGTIKTIPVTYTFDRQKHAIYRRQGDDRPRRIKGSFECLIVRRHGFHDYRKPAPSPPDLGGLLTFVVTGAQPEVLERPADQRSPNDRTTFCCSLPLRLANGRRAYPVWRPNVVAAP